MMTKLLSGTILAGILVISAVSVYASETGYQFFTTIMEGDLAWFDRSISSPEPTILLLLTIGFLSLVLARRKK